MKKIVLMVIAALALVSCGNKDADKKQEGKPQVKLTTVSQQEVPQTETYTATVESDVKNNISPNIAQRINRILVDVGDRVSRGQVLVQLDAANQDQLQLQLQSAQIQLQHQQIEFNRTAELYTSGGISKSEYESAETQLTVQQKQVAMLRTQLSQASQNTQLTSPISGVVTARNYDNGDMYSMGLPVLTIEQLNPVKLICNISETYFKDVTVGMPVDIQLDAYGDELFGGKVSIVYPSIDKATHTFPVEVNLPNSDQRVRPGMFARATVNFGSVERVLIPDMALVKQVGAGDRYVYVYKDGKVKYQKVELGKHMGDQYEVISGVTPNSQIVVAGQTRLKDGAEVEVVK
ncbi:MAG: efflux RND transporter periplasmic adaptor subunit [Prevotellaceae bacterium]|nr:efflux RND transporter periplasmic adaptor subunit [Candidatus Colivivens caballi]